MQVEQLIVMISNITNGFICSVTVSRHAPGVLYLKGSFMQKSKPVHHNARNATQRQINFIMIICVTHGSYLASAQLFKAPSFLCH
jgi:hypothetical protein